MPLLIGLAGRARSGKDTAALHFTARYNLVPYMLAAPLKDMLTTVFGNNFYGGDRERICPEAGISYRKMMQLLGTEWGRAVNPDLWNNLAAAKWAEVSAKGQGMVISDIRFDNEADMVRANGGIIIRVHRAAAEAIDGITGHASEIGVSADKVDYEVDNNAGIGDLYAALDDIVQMRLKAG